MRVVLNDVPVTIVGGGPVGLSMALALARLGIASRVIEQAPTTTDHPKARGVWPRAMEIFRQWGIDQAIRERGLPDKSDSFAVLDGLDNELGRSWPEPFHNEGPARKSIVAQDAVEEALATKLKEYPAAEVLWSTRALSGETHDDGVTITVEDLATGEHRSWRSSYLVGADGGAGFSANLADIVYEGPAQLGLMLNTYFRADLSAFKAAQDAAVLVFAPLADAPAADFADAPRLLNTNGADRWLNIERIGGETDERPRPRTEAETVEKLRTSLRQPTLDIQIINQGVWRLTRRIAATFFKNRVFLVGDAAHRFPPTGGFGMNSGIQDAHNLAWKLAYVIQGQASEKLLETYDIERRPIAHANADLALVNHGRYVQFLMAVPSRNLDKINFWLHEMDNHTNSIGHTLGFVYEAGAIVPDGTSRPANTPRVYTPTDRPGSRFPHFWLDADHTRSSLDLFDQNMVLVIGKTADAWADAAKKVANRRKLNIVVHRLGDVDPALGICMGPNGAALVRPDGVTAWRIGWVEPDPEALLDAAVAQILP